MEGVLKQAEAALRVVRLARELWGVAERRGFAGENSTELEAAGKRLEQMAHRLRGDIRHRTHPWKPQDPERFAQETARVKEAKFYTTEEVLAALRSKE
ncbi:MAG: hypothetical protein K2W96_17460 [Gemmataceae bacterium]|nr:hypothetical protein [Gemmataceae bacterium]